MDFANATSVAAAAVLVSRLSQQLSLVQLLSLVLAVRLVLNATPRDWGHLAFEMDVYKGVILAF